MAFHFRLAQILRLKQAVENMEKRQLQQKIAAQVEAETCLTHMREARSTFVRAMHHGEASGLPAARIGDVRRWYPTLVEQEHQQQQRLLLAEQAVEKQRQQLKAARSETRMLERLQERLSAAYEAEIGRREQFVLDELAVQSWPQEERL